MEEIYACLPTHIQTQFKKISMQVLNKVEEIRFRIGRRIELNINRDIKWLDYRFTEDDADFVLGKITNYSIYTMEEQLKRGFVTISGGHRIGLAGKVILEKGVVKAIRNVSSFNFRIAREQIGLAHSFAWHLLDNKRWYNTMIIGSPQSGKTTLLRDLARLASTGIEQQGIIAVKVGVVDERSEITGSVKGVPQLTFGERIDVLDGCPKAEGMMMFIRSLSPQLLIVDEIGRKEDCHAIQEAVNAGISLIATVHGHNLSDVQARPMIKKMIDDQFFQRYIEISRTDNQLLMIKILTNNGQIIEERKIVS